MQLEEKEAQLMLEITIIYILETHNIILPIPQKNLQKSVHVHFIFRLIHFYGTTSETMNYLTQILEKKLLH